MSVAPQRLFALDQGFPQNIVAALRESILEAELVWIGDVDPRLSKADDWEVLAALHGDSRSWDGLISTDAGMLNLLREVSVLCQTKLTLVIADAAGHDPLAATGLVLAHLPYICKQTMPDRAQLWRLRANRKPAEDPWKYIQAWAQRHGEKPNAVCQKHKLSDDRLRRRQHG